MSRQKVLNVIRITNASRKGTATVEAAIVLPLVILSFMSILSVIRISVTYERMQHALNQVASEMSQYSYLYAVSGLKEDHDNLNNEMNDALNQISQQHNLISTFYGEMQGLAGDIEQISNGDEDTVSILVNTVSNIKSGVASYGELSEQIESVIKDPMGQVRLIGLALSKDIFSEGKSLLLGLVSKGMLKRNLAKDLSVPFSELDDKLRLNDGIDGLDLSCSTFFDDNETIDLIAEYVVKPVPDFLFLPEIRLRNRACVLAWTDGVGGIAGKGAEDSENRDSIWNIDNSKNYTSQHFGRGNKVDKWYAEELKKGFNGNADTTPYNFPVVDLIEYSEGGKPGALFTIFSLNPFLPSYGKKSAVVGEIKKNLYKLKEFKKAESNGFIIDISELGNNYKRIVCIIIPENTVLPDAYSEAFDECLKIASKLDIELRQVQKYGEYGESAEVETEETAAIEAEG